MGEAIHYAIPSMPKRRSIARGLGIVSLCLWSLALLLASLIIEGVRFDHDRLLAVVIPSTGVLCAVGSIITFRRSRWAYFGLAGNLIVLAGEWYLVMAFAAAMGGP